MLHENNPPSVKQVLGGAGTPSCPLSPRPQQYAAPGTDVRAQVCAPPAKTDSKLTTVTGAAVVQAMLEKSE
jgi:hypothetical protein